MWNARKSVVPTGEMQEEAKRYLQLGLNVIPLQPPSKAPKSGKKPLFAWKEFQRRLATEQEIERWFFMTRNNIGVVTGAVSRIVVVDCDDDDALNWCQRSLAETCMLTRTGNGYHLFYRHPGCDVRNGAKLNGRNLDVRGDGGYVVAPPSVHASGRKYEKLGNWNIRPPLFDPAWLARPERKQPRVRQSHVHPNRIRYRARKYIDRIASVSGQGGDLALFRAACALIQRFGLSEDVALAELRQWNQTNAEPPWDDDRLCYKITEALRLK